MRYYNLYMIGALMSSLKGNLYNLHYFFILHSLLLLAVVSKIGYYRPMQSDGPHFLRALLPTWHADCYDLQHHGLISSLCHYNSPQFLSCLEREPFLNLCRWFTGYFCGWKALISSQLATHGDLIHSKVIRMRQFQISQNNIKTSKTIMSQSSSHKISKSVRGYQGL